MQTFNYRQAILWCALGTAFLPATATADPTTDREEKRYCSPWDVAFSPDGKTLAVSDRTGKALVIIDVPRAEVRQTVPLEGEATGIAWNANGQDVLVAEWGAGTLAEIDASDGSLKRRMTVQRHPLGVAVAADKNLIVVGSETTHQVCLLDATTGQIRAEIDVPHEPQFVAVSPDQSWALAANLLPAGRATDPAFAAVVSLIDLNRLQHVSDVTLPPGSSTVRQVAFSPDGKWAYVAHCVGRTGVPTTQLERGWVNTNALSIIDVAANQYYCTILLDHVMSGAADPWGVAVSSDGKSLWTSLSGIHELARLDLPRLHNWLAGGLPEDHWLAKPLSQSPSDRSAWWHIQQDGNQRSRLVNDLGALYSGDLIERFPTGGNGPRGISLSPDGMQLAVAHYFSGNVTLFDVRSPRPSLQTEIALGPSDAPDQARLGEIIFHDASYCFQHWLSCATCHPNGARVDAMNWDLLNDGLGNPKNSRSLLLSHSTPPMMSGGVRESMQQAVLKGFHFLHREPEPKDVDLVAAYLSSLKPVLSPTRLKNGQLSQAAQRGQKVFFSEQTGCGTCHGEPLYTNLKAFDVGTKGNLDRISQFDTPTLLEVYRTAPYLHDGSAADLHEVITQHNKHDQHGHTSQLTEQEILDLIEFLRSL